MAYHKGSRTHNWAKALNNMMATHCILNPAMGTWNNNPVPSRHTFSRKATVAKIFANKHINSKTEHDCKTNTEITQHINTIKQTTSTNWTDLPSMPSHLFREWLPPS